jgi:hypothetical protein
VGVNRPAHTPTSSCVRTSTHTNHLPTAHCPQAPRPPHPLQLFTALAPLRYAPCEDHPRPLCSASPPRPPSRWRRCCCPPGHRRVPKTMAQRRGQSRCGWQRPRTARSPRWPYTWGSQHSTQAHGPACTKKWPGKADTGHSTASTTTAGGAQSATRRKGASRGAARRQGTARRARCGVHSEARRVCLVRKVRCVVWGRPVAPKLRRVTGQVHLGGCTLNVLRLLDCCRGQTGNYHLSGHFCGLAKRARAWEGGWVTIPFPRDLHSDHLPPPHPTPPQQEKKANSAARWCVTNRAAGEKHSIPRVTK